MAKISNYSVSGKRKYYDGTSWHTEEMQMGQFPTKENFTGNDLLYKRPTNQTGGFSGLGGTFGNYAPGIIYKPKKNYSFNDIFFSEEAIAKAKEVLLDWWSDIVNIDDTQYYYFYPSNHGVGGIIPMANDNYYYYPMLYVTMGKPSIFENIINTRMVYVWVYMVKTTYSPDNFQVIFHPSKENYNNPFLVNDNGTWRKATTSEYITSTLTYLYCQNKKTDFSLALNNMFDYCRKAKYFFLATLNGLYNSNSGDYLSSNAVNYKANYFNVISVYLMIDGGNLPFMSNACFMQTLINFRDGVTDFAVDSTKSPSPTKNPEDDDPNDDDPGSQGGGGGGGGGGEGGDGDHDDTSDDIPEPPIPGISGTSNGLITAWNLSPSQLAALAKKLWSPDALEVLKQYFTNPMGAILSLSIIPVAPKTSSGVIHLGGYNTEITANKLGTDYVNFDCGSIPINRYYGSYLDYSPFTKISCYLPYIGEVDIDPDQVMQKTLRIKYHINCITGEAVALLLADGSVFANYSGNCAKQMPICQSDFSSIVSASVQLCSTLITAGATAGMGGATEKSLFGATTEATKASESLVKANSSLLGSVMSAKMNYRHSSQLGTGAGQLAPQAPFLTIIRPNLDLADNYKAYTGYPCNKNLDLSALHGFTVAEACNLSVPSASLEEISEIKELLLKGVIL